LARRAAQPREDSRLPLAPSEREELWFVLEDAASSALARAGAAIVLARDLKSTEDAARLKAAAESSALPAFRVAVRHALEQSDEDLEEALAELEAEEVDLAKSATTASS
jgi:hypothetical protein